MQKEYRKRAKKKMAQAKEEGNAFMEQLYNGQQLAFKIVANSVSLHIYKCIFCLLHQPVFKLSTAHKVFG